MDVLSLYEQHKNMVYRLALSYLKSGPDAEDVCQTVFVKLMENRERIRSGKIRSWLASVTVNLCRDILRSAERKRTEPLAEEIIFRTPEQSDLFQAVMALGEGERTAVYLHYYEGYSTAETARILGISQTAVTTRLGRAREKLRKRLEEEVHE